MIQKDEARARAVYNTISEYGLGAEGHFWKDDLEAMEWSGPVPEIVKHQTGVWLILGSAADFTTSVLQGLSLAALSARGLKGGQLPIMILADDPEAVTDKLPPALAFAQVFSPNNPSLGAKITARANMPLKPVAAEYRFNVYALPKVGLWLETGPINGAWQGVLFGTAGATIDAMGIGPSGKIPERSALEYPLRNMTLDMDGQALVAWAARNIVSENDSVYVRVKGQPEMFVFGPFDPEADAIDGYTLPLGPPE